MTPHDPPKKLTRKDFVSDQEVRWCPGCGDYAIVAAVQKTLPELGVSREKTVFISGIGCSSRFPYYMNTYGFHTIHGRAPALATGVKLANPELDVWVITGDGDGLSIGGNHFLHLLRRNVNLQIILFNNRIYGLTKGQYSPTSLIGKRSPSTPLGSIDYPVTPAAFALGCGARHVSRAIDIDAKNLGEMLKRAHAFQGTGMIEVFQNCPVFNDGAFTHFTERATAADTQLHLEHGKPMIFGKDRSRGLRLRPGSLDVEVVTIGEDGITEADLLVHDETNRAQAFLLAGLEPPSFPVALGVLYSSPAASFEGALLAQNEQATASAGVGDIDKLLRKGHTWTVSGE
ncbi:MAG: 2-oxoacid:ferredoxin oxidoreductase subunit beta [Myxococcales bacterium]|nr:2-oxoacid:ferredoxin oxidoreductase subunit beta [Myxococcales bacterium]MCB9700609.1 2-oxoacid:ferredoxin oxidoreductase subunit beta [Myxococcales bacterium]